MATITGTIKYDEKNCYISLSTGETISLSHEDCSDIFLAAADALNININERDRMYFEMIDSAEKEAQIIG